MNWPTNPISQMLQQDSRGLRSVRVCAVRRARTDLVVTTCVDEGVCVCRRLAVPEWECPRDIEEWCEPLGWALGSAWLVREYWAPARKPSALTLIDFGINVYGVDLLVGDQCPDLLAEAVAGGYWHWTFQPRWRVPERFLTDGPDDTVNAEGRREPPFPGWRMTFWTEIAKRFETLAEVEQRTHTTVAYCYASLQVE